jgi:magnesium transporter
MIYFSKKTNEVEVEQVSLIVGSNYVITFHEKESDILD